MSFLSWVSGIGRRAVATGRDPASDIWWQSLNAARASSAGAVVSPETAMRLMAVHACVRVLADSVAQLPLKIQLKTGNGNVEPVDDHPLNTIFNRRANQRQNGFQFRQMLMGHLALRGNAYARIVQGGLGAISELVPMHPDNVQPELLDSGRVRYKINLADGRQETLTQDEVWHLRGLVMSEDGVTGLDPITAMRESIGMGLAAQDYGGSFFRNDARPSGVIEHPAHFRDGEDRKTWKDAWRSAFGGGNRFSTAVLEFGMTYKPIGMTNEQAQFLETRKLTDVDIARGFRVQPHKIAILDRATFSNVEQQSLEFVTDTLMPWLVNWESSINNDLIVGPRPETLTAKFNVNALLRGAIKERFGAYAVGRQWGWLSANDVRRFEDMNGIGPDGDIYLVPMNMTPADQIEETEDDDTEPGGDNNFERDGGEPDADGETEQRRNGADDRSGVERFLGRRDD